MLKKFSCVFLFVFFFVFSFVINCNAQFRELSVEDILERRGGPTKLTSVEILFGLEPGWRDTIPIESEIERAIREPHCWGFMKITYDEREYDLFSFGEDGVATYRTKDEKEEIKIGFRNYNDPRYADFPHVIFIQKGDKTYSAYKYVDSERRVVSFTLKDSTEVVYEINLDTRTITKVQ